MVVAFKQLPSVAFCSPVSATVSAQRKRRYPFLVEPLGTLFKQAATFLVDSEHGQSGCDMFQRILSFDSVIRIVA